FFARDLTEELLLNKSQFFNIENRGHRLKITNKEKNIYYEFKNRKIIKTINHSGNITLLNNVIEAQFTMLRNKRMKLYVKLYNEGTYFEKEIYFEYKTLYISFCDGVLYAIFIIDSDLYSSF